MRTPISSMRVALEVLRLGGEDPERRHKLLSILNRHVDELAGLVDAFENDPQGFLRDELAGRSPGTEGGAE